MSLANIDISIVLPIDKYRNSDKTCTLGQGDHMKRKTGRPQGRRASGLDDAYVTVSFSLPKRVTDALRNAALQREDLNKSAVVSDALMDYFGIEPMPEMALAGGESPEKQETPA
jgi:hypothetical protein